MLTDAQRNLLIRMGCASNALRNFDEARPMWWLEGQLGGVRANVAEALIRKDLVRLTGHWGGQPGILGFTVTEAGRRALAEQAGGER